MENKVKKSKFPMCQEPECKTHANYGVEGTSKALYCAKHKKDGHVQLNKKKCLECTKAASYGFMTDPKKERMKWCSTHAEGKLKGDEKAVDLKNKKCPVCGIEPSFNYLGEKRGKYCGEHKLEGMVDVKHPKCQRVGCETLPVFNVPGAKSGKYCIIHKEDDMVNVVSKTCEFVNDKGVRCDTMPSYGPAGKPQVRCTAHKKEDDVMRQHKTCVYPDCKARPYYAKENEQAMYCERHAPEGTVDKIRPRCNVEGCNAFAHYGVLFEKASRCRDHAPNSYYHESELNPKCVSIRCKNRPMYIDPGVRIPTHCEKHHKEDQINIVEKPCAKCQLPAYIPSNRVECLDCYEFEQYKARKLKETRVKLVLDTAGIKYTSYDRSVDTQCTRRRPDFVIDCPKFQIVVEVDEHQHDYGAYNNDCEIKRMIEIHQSIGMNTIFIRYNPDTYVDAEGNERRWDTSREVRLVNLIKQYQEVDMLPHYLCVIKLCYDRDDGQDHLAVIDYDFTENALVHALRKLNL